VALVFGPEKRGLTREDLALCHVLVEIPTDARQPSMNLGQAVAVCLYELAMRGKAYAHRGDENEEVAKLGRGNPTVGDADLDATRDPACGRDLELLAEVVVETMQAANYSPAAMQKANRHDLGLLLRRLTLDQQDARRILGLFRRILWRLKR
jgi:tRNA C32,U32 (ribose-2'-O)-methylase TrmJ